jgi:hypothetical protein
MADNIIIKITTEANLDAAQKQLKALTDRAKEQERALQDLSDQEKQDAQALKQNVVERERLEKALKRNKDYYRDLRQQQKEDISATKQSIKSLQDQIKAYNTLHGQGGRMVQQLRAMREELQRMEDSGEFGTKAFMDLAIAAGQLEDQIGDTQQRIRILSSDTRGLDTVMGVQDGIAGAFYVATSAAEVFGADLEGLQTAFYRVQAAMSAVQGVQQIANMLNKDSVVMVNLQTLAEKLREKVLRRNAAATAANTAATSAQTVATGAQTAATGAATAAQWSLNAAMDANPLGALIAIIVAAVAALAALGYGLVKLIPLMTESGRATRDYDRDLKELEKVQQHVGIMNEYYAQKIENNVHRINQAHQKEVNAAKQRNASDLELLMIEKKSADERAKVYAENIPKALKEQEKAVVASKKVLEDAQRIVNNTRGEKKRKEALEKLKEAQDQYNSSQDEYNRLQQERDNALQESIDAEMAIAEKRKELREQLVQANIDLMRDGKDKEIAQIRQSYKEQLKEITGQTEEETALRKALLKKQAKELAEVRKKYQIEEKRLRIAGIENLISLEREQLGAFFGEEDYAKELMRMKNILAEEYNMKVASLDRTRMSTQEYNMELLKLDQEYKSKKRELDVKELERIVENQKRTTDILVKEAENRANKLTGAELPEYQKEIWDSYYEERRKQLEEDARLEMSLVNASLDTAEVKAEKEKQINAQLQADLEALRKEGAEKEIAIDAQLIDELQRNADEAASEAEKAQGGKLEALKVRYDAEMQLYQAQQDQLKAQYDAGLITYQEYKNQEFEISKAITDAEVQYQTEKMQTIAEGFETALGYMQQVSDLAFEAINNNIQAQMDALDEMYTTDAQEAKENANKKYISEKELADKKAALELKQAKYAKAQALINAGINTAQAIITTIAQLGATPWGLASAAIAAMMGAAQIGIIASKPLAQYAKGRKGGKGEYALVGEEGPEIMYVPAGASIIPNNKMGDVNAWGQYGVPALPIPATADINQDVINQAMISQAMVIDYDRLGKAVAANIPKQQAVSVNVDRSGVTIDTNGNRRTYLNHKYTGAWS